MSVNVTQEEDPSSEPRRGYTRHDARELALQILFQCDFHGSTEFWLEQFWTQRDASESVRTFTSELVTGVRTHQVELDGLIAAYARNWTVDRMPVVDRNILRQAMYELLWVPDVPAKVTVDEALELAKNFADDETRRFVNGILDQLIKHDSRLEPKRDALAF
ncbi:MAG: transcription antitermination factor NusB [Nitrospira sp. SB0678_bin_10]|nr:transcription antitermination factor NusB [Nitrospira sp. SB0678_bin_10]MYI89200.1 transcription antitermination factor NusB [Gammaproteobacteria bacterium]